MKNILRRIDQDWLLNQPELWATRVHYFLPVYILILAVTYLVGFSLPMNTANVPEVEAHFGLSLLLSGIVYLIWGFKASEFQITKQFGETSFWAQLKTQGIYLVITCMMGFVPFVYMNTLAKREAKLVTDKQLVYDCNMLNIGTYYIEVSRLKADFAVRVEAEKANGDTTLQLANMTMPSVGYYKKFSLYGGMGEWNEEQIVAHIGKNKEEQMAQIEAFIETLQKYGGEINETAAEIYAFFQGGETGYYFNDSYKVEKRLSDISRAKTEKISMQASEFQGLSIFVAFCVALTLFTFVATSLRTFLIAIITGIIGAMFLGLTGSFFIYAFDIHSNEENIFGFAYILLVGVLAAFGALAGTKPRVILAREVALSIATVLTPFLPIAVMIMLDIKINRYDYEGQMYVYEWILYAMIAFSTLGTWLIWNILYRPQLLKIQTIPVKN